MDKIKDYFQNMNLNKETIITLIIIFVIFWFIKQNIMVIIGAGVLYLLYVNVYGVKQENFNRFGNKFVYVGAPRYDLKGQLLNTMPADHYVEYKYPKHCWKKVY